MVPRGNSGENVDAEMKFIVNQNVKYLHCSTNHLRFHVGFLTTI